MSQGGFNFDFVVELLMKCNQSTGNEFFKYYVQKCLCLYVPFAIRYFILGYLRLENHSVRSSVYSRYVYQFFVKRIIGRLFYHAS